MLRRGPRRGDGAAAEGGTEPRAEPRRSLAVRAAGGREGEKVGARRRSADGPDLRASGCAESRRGSGNKGWQRPPCRSGERRRGLGAALRARPCAAVTPQSAAPERRCGRAEPRRNAPVAPMRGRDRKEFGAGYSGAPGRP